MKVLVVNSGSSSIKYRLFDMDNETVLAKGLIERIGIEGSKISHYPTGKETLKKEIEIPDHRKGIEILIESLLNDKYGVLTSISEISAVGHRVVHGGEKYSGSVLINEDVINTLNEYTELAPLHNPANILGIKVCQELLPDIPQVGVFDTAFHQSIPEQAFLYGLPYYYYKKYRIRRYGFHGTSHKYVAQKASEMLGQNINELKIISCHLGNGSSITAVKEGKSIDTSLGFGTISGVIMGTRCGDIDPAIIPYLMEKEKISINEMNDILYRKSGFIGLSEGVSSDMRDLEEESIRENESSKTLDVLFYGIKKYIGAYTAIMNGLDVLVFTAGIGENSPLLREKVCTDMDFLGIKFDNKKNDGLKGKKAIISADDSKVAVLVIPTNEELMIAIDTAEICNK